MSGRVHLCVRGRKTDQQKDDSQQKQQHGQRKHPPGFELPQEGERSRRMGFNCSSLALIGHTVHFPRIPAIRIEMLKLHPTRFVVLASYGTAPEHEPSFDLVGVGVAMAHESARVRSVIVRNR